MDYKIYIAALGQGIDYFWPYCTINRSSISKERLIYNLNHLWAWNISNDCDIYGNTIKKFAADGPACFIEYNNGETNGLN